MRLDDTACGLELADTRSRDEDETPRRGHREIGRRLLEERRLAVRAGLPARPWDRTDLRCVRKSIEEIALIS